MDIVHEIGHFNFMDIVHEIARETVLFHFMIDNVWKAK